MRTLSSLAIAALLGLLSVIPAAAQDRDVDAELDAVYERFTAAYAAADPDAVAQLYAKDAFLPCSGRRRLARPSGDP